MDKGIWNVVIKENFKPVKTVENLSYSDMLIEKDKWSSLLSFEYKNTLNTIYSKDKNTLKIINYIDDKCYEFLAKKQEKEGKNTAIVGEYYRHFKGGLYKLIDIATGSEDGVEYAVYIGGNPYKTWVRPLEMFLSPKPADAPNTYCTKWRFEREV